MFLFSPNGLFLISERSVLLNGGPIIVLRPRFPYVPRAGVANAATLNQRSTERSLLERYGLPIRLGRSVSAAPVLLISARIDTVNGRPDWTVLMPEISHPRINQSPTFPVFV